MNYIITENIFRCDAGYNKICRIWTWLLMRNLSGPRSDLYLVALSGDIFEIKDKVFTLIMTLICLAVLLRLIITAQYT